MRKNGKVGSYIKGLINYRVKINGLNLDMLINSLRRQGITLTNVVKGEKSVTLTVRGKEFEKFFAICTNLCYNIQIIKTGGKLYPVYYLYKNIGIAIGIAVFFALSFLFGNMLFTVEYYGDGSDYSYIAQEVLSENGIKPFTFFSEIDLDGLANDIFSKTDKFVFVNAKRQGNRLVIQLIEKKQPHGVVDYSLKEIVSDVEGVIESVNLLRGTSLVKAGDKITVGQKIADGYETVKDNVIETGVFGSITVVTSKSYEYSSKQDGEKDIAVILAEQTLGESEKSEVKVIKLNDLYFYKVTLYYKRIYTAK